MTLELLQTPEVAEVVGLRIAELLKLEFIRQQALATAASEDPRLWALRVFHERANPFAEFLDSPYRGDAAPVVNVRLDSVSFDASSSSVVGQQTAIGTYQIDSYGYGVSKDDPAGGHTPGDLRAALETQRAVRLVRQILMAAENTYLGLRGVVWKRWVHDISYVQPQPDAKSIQHIVGGRVSLEVTFSETAPQVPAETLELIGGTVFRSETGEILLRADHTKSSDP